MLKISSIEMSHGKQNQTISVLLTESRIPLPLDNGNNFWVQHLGKKYAIGGVFGDFCALLVYWVTVHIDAGMRNPRLS